MNNIIYNYKSFKSVHNLKLSNLLDKKMYFTGSFSYAQKYKKNNLICLRDSAGSRKIFYGIHKKKRKLIFSDNYLSLKKDCDLKSIFSTPKGSLVIINSSGNIIYQNKISIQKVKFSKYFTSVIKKNLIKYLKEIKKKHGNKCIVCLSGGLDSTIIAYYANKVFDSTIALTASFGNNKTQSLDAIHAKKISKFLNIKNISLNSNYHAIRKELKNILFSAQDWKDYNIHCATLNFFIAKYLNKKNIKIPILTGDMMNEYFADYQNEIFDGKFYYQKPKISKKLYQKYLINSLDSSSREIGVFNYFNINLFQPYSALIDIYNNIPNKIFKKSDCKYEINGKLIPKSLLKLILKSKNRAQLVDDHGGILGYFIRNKMDQKYLFNKYKKFFHLKNSWITNFINVGLFRSKSLINSSKF